MAFAWASLRLLPDRKSIYTRVRITGATSLLLARAIQGLGGAIVAAVSLSLIVNLFRDATERTRALAIYGLVCAAGGGIGDVLGGVLTQGLSWRWIFLVNIPIGGAVYALSIVLLPSDRRSKSSRNLDVWGAFVGTTGLTVLIYAIVAADASDWLTVSSNWLLVVGGGLTVLFICIESRVSAPVMPLRLFRSPNFRTANIVGALWSAATYDWFVIGALHLQRILGYDSFQVGVAFLPSEIVMAVLSAWISAKMVARFGPRLPLWGGLLLTSAGLLLFSRASVQGVFWIDVLPAMLLLGIGAGIASPPLLLAATSDVPEEEAGLGSGTINTSFVMGGALGLAVLGSAADLCTRRLQYSGTEYIVALNAGYRVAFELGAALTAAAAVLAAFLIRPTSCGEVMPQGRQAGSV